MQQTNNPPPPPAPPKPASRNLPRRFGKYVLLDHLAEGGMAEVYRARELTEISPGILSDKIFAMKLLHRSKVSDPSFHRLFLDEIRVASSMVHPNIVQTYDYGEIQGRKFASMELVNGKSLDFYLEILAERSKRFPIDVSCYIVSQSCIGLNYAHQSINPLTGQKNNIVHRDISPQNIIVDYNGNVKIIDFGVAKAASNTEKTAVGMLKGKISYMAPEALIDNAPVDHRYDQFATALVLWDLLTGKKAFDGDSVMTITRKVFECNLPRPSTLNPSIPPELETIIMKALAKDKDARYKDIDEFSRALTGFLYTNNPNFSSSDFAKFMQSEFAPQYEQATRDLINLGKIPIGTFLDEYRKETTQVTLMASKDALTNPQIRRSSVPSPATPQKPTTSVEIQRELPPIPQKNNSLTVAILLLSMAILGGGYLYYKGQIGEKKIDPTLAQNTSATIDESKIGLITFMNTSDKKRVFINNKEIAYEGQTLDLGFDSQFNLRVLGKDGLTAFSYFKRSQNQDLSSYRIDDLTKLLLDEKNILDLFTITKDFSDTFEIRIEEPGKRPYFGAFNITPETRQQVIFVPDQESVEHGAIITTADIPTGYRLSYEIEGHLVSLELPLKRKHSLPTGIYSAKISNRQGELVKEIKLLINKDGEQLISL